MHNAIMKTYHNWVKSFLKVACKSDKKILQKTCQKKPNDCLLIFKTGNLLKICLLIRKIMKCGDSLYMVHCKCLQGFQGLCGEIGVQGIQIYGDCMYTGNPCNFEISTL